MKTYTFTDSNFSIDLRRLKIIGKKDDYKFDSDIEFIKNIEIKITTIPVKSQNTTVLFYFNFLNDTYEYRKVTLDIYMFNKKIERKNVI